MKVALFSFYSKNTPQFETELEILQNHLKSKDEITVFGCNAELLSCDLNPYKNPLICAICWGRRKAGLQMLSSKVSYHSLIHLNSKDQEELRRLPTKFDDMQALRSFCLGDFDIGCGVLSSVVSMFRDPQPDLAHHWKIVRNLIWSSFAIYRSALNHLEEIHFDRVYVFNGRPAPLRSVMRACEAKQIPFFVHEIGHDTSHYAVYESSSPHDMRNIEHLIRRAWALSSPDREKIATTYFEKRSKGMGSWYSYVNDQDPDLLPANWNSSKRNIVIFNSSEDEFVAIGKALQNPVYASQEQGIRQIVASMSDLPEDIHLYLRMHPNLKSTSNQSTERLKKISGQRFTLILPENPVSTYTLMKEAEKVITFGSTVGIEAVFWTKPSILLDDSFYRNLGGTYTPTNHQETIDLIQQNLPAKSSEAAMMYGYYMATFGIPFQYYESESITEGKFLGHKITAKAWMEKTIKKIEEVPAISNQLNRLFLAIVRKRITGKYSGRALIQ